MTCVAGGLKLTHPSVLPFIKELVSKLFPVTLDFLSFSFCGEVTLDFQSLASMVRL